MLLIFYAYANYFIWEQVGGKISTWRTEGTYAYSAHKQHALSKVWIIYSMHEYAWWLSILNLIKALYYILIGGIKCPKYIIIYTFVLGPLCILFFSFVWTLDHSHRLRRARQRRARETHAEDRSYRSGSTTDKKRSYRAYTYVLPCRCQIGVLLYYAGRTVRRDTETNNDNRTS